MGQQAETYRNMQEEKGMEMQVGTQEEARMETFSMEFMSSSENEEFARVTAAVFLSRLDPTVEEMEDVKTAVSEAVTNAEIHGYGGGEGPIRMRVSIEGHEVTVEVSDTGRGIPDVKKAMEPLFTTDCTGERSGMGFSFMEAFMDSVQVESVPGAGTRVILKKRIGDTASPSAGLMGGG